MRREHLDPRMREEWRKSAGTLDEATDLIVDAIKCGRSKGEKIATGRYPNRLSQLELAALTNLMALPSAGVVTSSRKKGA
ncbi:MAG: hypothetical protein EOP06_09905 [Proteobacteria bacterium]|nr:MAG: hypothetical protein EOP06_09905 [Pseudomonadota bacterium]